MRGVGGDTTFHRRTDRRTDGQTDRHDDYNTPSANFLPRGKKVVLNLRFQYENIAIALYYHQSKYKIAHIENEI